MPSLGRLKKLDAKEIRKIWPNEEKDLSRWISDNVETLNEALNLQIEIEGKEEPVGSFRLDLIGTDGLSKTKVVVENQFGVSNRDHLGKVITYAAGKDAGIVIWIANQFQDAHKNAIEWLNKVTPPEMKFYGLELQVVQIENSLPAPQFSIVAEPPPEKRETIGGISARYKKYQDFFDKLRATTLKYQPNFTRRKTGPYSSWTVAAGRSGFSVSAAFTNDSKFRIELYIDTGLKDDNKKAFSELKQKKTQIEDQIGKDLTWDSSLESRLSRIYLPIDGTIDDDERKLAEIIEWAAPLMVKFREVFGPLVKNLEIGP